MNKLQLAIQAYQLADKALTAKKAEPTGTVRICEFGTAPEQKGYRIVDVIQGSDSEVARMFAGSDVRLVRGASLAGSGSYFEYAVMEREDVVALTEARTETLNQALFELGVFTGNAFMANTGPLDQRVSLALRQADMLRKQQIDGMGYVDIRDEEGAFARAFYGVTGLKRQPLFDDLMLCCQARCGQRTLNEEEKKRLGFAVEVADESR